LKEAVRVFVKCVAFQIGQLIRIAVEELALTSRTHDGVSKSPAQSDILYVVEIGTAFAFLFFLFLTASPFGLILLIKQEKLRLGNQIQIQRTASRDKRAHFVPETNRAERVSSLF